MFENRVLRKMCEPKRDELTGEGRRLRNEEFYALYNYLLTYLLHEAESFWRS